MKKTIPWAITWFMALMLVFSLNTRGQETINIVQNGDFENWTDGLPDNWVGAITNLPVNGIVEYKTSTYTGASACQLIRTSGTHARFTTDPLSIIADTEYTVTYYARGKGEIRNAFHRDGAYSGYSAYTVLDTDDWTEIVYTFEYSTAVNDVEVIFSVRNTDEVRDHLQIDNVSITYEEVAGVVATPTFSPSGGTFFDDVDVTIATTTDNATIYYSTEANDGPWAEYTEPVAVTETTTLYAYATAADLDDSNVATATFDFPTVVDVADVAALRAGSTDGTFYRLTAEAILTYQQSFRNQKFIQDATAGIMIDDNGGVITTAYDLYDGITSITGTISVFGNMVQFVPAVDPGAATSKANEVEPVVISMQEFNDNFMDYQSRLVTVENISFDVADGTDFANGQVYALTDGLLTAEFRTTFFGVDYIGQPVPSGNGNITGLPNSRSDGNYMTARNLADFEEYEEPLPATVVDIITGSEVHTTLADAVIAADLVDALSAEGPFTVFAPTDAAFDLLPDGLLDGLTVEELTDILLYHVVDALAMSTDLVDGQVIPTLLLGQDVVVTIADGDVFINNAQVTVADLEAENGVVHVIDAVLLPTYDIQITENDTYGSILTDGAGNTLYFFTLDADGSSACVGACLNNWPIFYEESPYLSAGLDPDDFDAIDRGEGVMQTTYKGWPLYYFANDNEAGDVKGEAINNKWFVAKPDYTVMLTDNQLVGADGLNYTGDYTEGEEIVQYLVDAYGNTLYTWVNDHNNLNRFTAADFSNNAAWPIFDAEGMIVPSTLNADDFGVIDVYGEAQLTFKGWPLYNFGQDNIRGETKGVSVPEPGIWPVPVPGMMEALPLDVATLAELRALPADGTPYHYTGEAVIVAMDGFRNRKFLQDETAAIMIDDQPGVITTEYDLYDEITNVVGEIVVFRQLVQFQPQENTDPATQNTPVDPYDFTIPDITSDDQAKLVKLHNVTFTGITDGQVFENGTNYTITDGTNEMVLRTDFWNVDYIGEEIPDTPLNITGVISQRDDVFQLFPRFAADFEEYVEPLPATVVDIIVGSPDHTLLAGAVAAAGLVETLQGEGPFTVFAPTDDAINALPAGLLEGLSVEELTNILLYHVVGALALSTDLEDGDEITTLLGQDVVVTISADGVFINDAQVTLADLEADNGVVHVIDAVLLPQQEPTVAAPTPTIDAANVISLFSDAYTDVPVDTWRTDWSVAAYEEVLIDGNPTKKYTNLDFVGIETVANQIDITGMTHFHLDVWSPNATMFRVKLVDFGADAAFGGGDDTEHEVQFPDLTQGEWVSLDIPLADFTDLAGRQNIAQLILSGLPTGELTVYVDNVFFYTTGTNVNELDAAQNQVRVYPNPARDNFNITAESVIRSIVVADITGKVVYNDIINDTQTRIHNAFESGIYIVHIYTDEGVFVRKLQIQK